MGKISLKRKPGGTFVGNMLRGLVNKQTDGVFGNGAMMQQEGETTEQANARMIEGLGAAASSFSSTASKGVQMPDEKESDFMKRFKSGVIGDKVKTLALPLMVLPLVVLLVVKLFKKSKKRR